ncbi:MAG: hypothetical protein PHZ00_03735 [Candidatus Peribacteraceae bacterium]|nr:hypothetical protein [Candidatus Peribacteraceae bacterium]
MSKSGTRRASAPQEITLQKESKTTPDLSGFPTVQRLEAAEELSGITPKFDAVYKFEGVRLETGHLIASLINNQAIAQDPLLKNRLDAVRRKVEEKDDRILRARKADDKSHSDQAGDGCEANSQSDR